MRHAPIWVKSLFMLLWMTGFGAVIGATGVIDDRGVPYDAVQGFLIGCLSVVMVVLIPRYRRR